jgi:hypothetical protein
MSDPISLELPATPRKFEDDWISYKKLAAKYTSDGQNITSISMEKLDKPFKSGRDRYFITFYSNGTLVF